MIALIRLKYSLVYKFQMVFLISHLNIALLLNLISVLPVLSIQAPRIAIASTVVYVRGVPAAATTKAGATGSQFAAARASACGRGASGGGRGASGATPGDGGREKWGRDGAAAAALGVAV